MRRMILPLMLLVIAACQPTTVEQQAVTTGPDVEAITTAFEQAVAAANARDVEGVLSVYADDAMSMSPNEPPTNGKAAIRASFQPTFAENTIQITARPDEVVVAGDLAVMRTSYEETVTPRGEGEPVELRGDWLIVWRKQSDGSWKFWRDMYSIVPPPATEAESM